VAPQNLGFAHTGQTVQQHTRHAVVQRVAEQGIEMSEHGICSRISNPTIEFESSNAFLGAQQSIGATIGKQVLKIFGHTKSPRDKVRRFPVPGANPQIPPIGDLSEKNRVWQQTPKRVPAFDAAVEGCAVKIPSAIFDQAGVRKASLARRYAKSVYYVDGLCLCVGAESKRHYDCHEKHCVP
jgi:hypothetical protein